MYVYVDMSETRQLGNAAVLQSTRFPPPPKYHSNPASPYFNSCQVVQSPAKKKTRCFVGRNLIHVSAARLPAPFFSFPDGFPTNFRSDSSITCTAHTLEIWWSVSSKKIRATDATTNRPTFGESRAIWATCGAGQPSLCRPSKTGKAIFPFSLFFFLLFEMKRNVIHLQHWPTFNVGQEEEQSVNRKRLVTFISFH